MHLTIRHITEYTFDVPVSYALQKIRLRPHDSSMQDILEWELSVEGGRIETSYRDHYGNWVDLVSADIGVNRMAITAAGKVSTRDTVGILGEVYGRAPLWHFAQPTRLTEAGPNIEALAQGLRDTAPTPDALHALSTAIIAAVPYETGATEPETPAEEAVNIGKGVCQDHANIFASAVRLAGLPARYVSGYLMMNDRVDQDASHAWAEVHLDALGWVGFDVSNGVSPDERYVRIAVGRDAHDAAPISGLRMGHGDETMIVSLQVQQ